MPEIFEADYFFPCYIWFFIVIITLLHGLNVIGLWSDLSTGECTASVDREVILLAYARTLDKQALARGCLSGLANDLQDFADAIPDTHGLMIHAVWQGLPPIIRCQISLNHASWESFCNVLQELRLDIETVPPLWRDPDPTNTKKKKKARSVSPVQSNVSDSDDEDIDTATIIQQSDYTEIEDLTVPSQPPKASHGEGTDLSCYFWPLYALPVLSSTALSAHDAISSAGMRLGAAYSQGPTKEEGEEANLHCQIQNRIRIQAKFDCSHPCTRHEGWPVRSEGVELLLSLFQFSLVQRGISAISERKLNSMHLKDTPEWTFSNNLHLSKADREFRYRRDQQVLEQARDREIAAQARTARHSSRTIFPEPSAATTSNSTNESHLPETNVSFPSTPTLSTPSDLTPSPETPPTLLPAVFTPRPPQHQPARNPHPTPKNDSSDDDMVPPKTTELFRGNGTAEKAHTWLRTLEGTWKYDADEKEKMYRFEKGLHPGSQAEEWWNGLTAMEKQTWATLMVSFEKKWPKPKTTRRAQDVVIAELANNFLDRSALGKYIKDEDGTNVLSHVAWAEVTRKLLDELPGGDASMMLKSSIRATLPVEFRRLISDTGLDTWEKYLKAVEDISVDLITDEVELHAERHNTIDHDIFMWNAANPNATAAQHQAFFETFANKLALDMGVSNPFQSPSRVSAPVSPQYVVPAARQSQPVATTTRQAYTPNARAYQPTPSTVMNTPRVPWANRTSPDVFAGSTARPTVPNAFTKSLLSTPGSPSAGRSRPTTLSGNPAGDVDLTRRITEQPRMYPSDAAGIQRYTADMAAWAAQNGDPSSADYSMFPFTPGTATQAHETLNGQAVPQREQNVRSMIGNILYPQGQRTPGARIAQIHGTAPYDLFGGFDPDQPLFEEEEGKWRGTRRMRGGAVPNLNSPEKGRGLGRWDVASYDPFVLFNPANTQIHQYSTFHLNTQHPRRYGAALPAAILSLDAADQETVPPFCQRAQLLGPDGAIEVEMEEQMVEAMDVEEAAVEEVEKEERMGEEERWTATELERIARKRAKEQARRLHSWNDELSNPSPSLDWDTYLPAEPTESAAPGGRWSRALEDEDQQFEEEYARISLIQACAPWTETRFAKYLPVEGTSEADSTEDDAPEGSEGGNASSSLDERQKEKLRRQAANWLWNDTIAAAQRANAKCPPLGRNGSFIDKSRRLAASSRSIPAQCALRSSCSRW
ncbi:hypothetical protein B0H10DRAFT_1943684 [Mycena sp. CBHHK59/15]|nr:hypothetical protein B0H10DRAFT_1943684 [Mycena sp. CBHHK59/15]